MKMKCLPALLAATLGSAVHLPGLAQEDAPEPTFDPKGAFEYYTGLNLEGFLQIGASTNTKSSHTQSTGGHSNFPITGPADEGLQFNALQLMISRDIKTNILPRITPLPGPMPWEYSWGMRAELMYGRNGLPAGMQGFDANWGVNRTPAGTVPGSTRQNYLAMPQVFAQFYAPWGHGMALTVGRFGAGVGYEIPPAIRQAPNFFYSHTFMFVAQPDQVAGALLSAHLMEGPYGLLGGEVGVVNGRQNWRDNNDSRSVLGALRWRSSDMNTWIDYSFMVGNEQNDPSTTPQMPIARLISPRGQRREHHSLVAQFKPGTALRAAVEYGWGRQKGDGQADTIDILTGPGFTGAQYSGISGLLAYRVAHDLELGLRGETFRDPKGFALFPTTAVPGNFNAVTLGARYNFHKNVLFRPEVRYDWQTRNSGVQAYGSGTASRQTTVSADLVLYY